MLEDRGALPNEEGHSISSWLSEDVEDKAEEMEEMKKKENRRRSGEWREEENGSR